MVCGAAGANTQLVAQPSAARPRPILCILETGVGLLTGFQAHFGEDGRRKPRAFGAAALLCLALLALLAVAQVAHTHSLESDADHCPLCIVLNSAAPVAVMAAVVILVQVGTPVPVVEPRTVTRHRHPKLFTRPPPIAC